ncbi:hypothetical protein RJ640_004878, partial [Escallonia rubra]
MGGESRYEIGQNAYIKLALHALKHKTSAVNGVLLGRLSGSDASPVVEVTESVPLFHSQIGVLAPLEIALIMIEEYYGAQGLSIVGYFHANERFDDAELGNLFTKDASKSWKLVGSDGSSRLSLKEPSANIVLMDYISSGKWMDIIDFDDHLDDISKRREIRQTIGYFYSQAGSPVNVGEQMFLAVLNVITSMLWGGTVKGEERASLGAEFRQVVAQMTELLGMPNVSDFYPGLARFDLQGIREKMKGLALRFDKIFETMIDQRLKMGGQGSKDFLQFLLQLKNEGDAKMPL